MAASVASQKNTVMENCMQCVFTTNLDQQVSKGVSECLCYMMAHVSVCNLIDNNNNNNGTQQHFHSGSSSAGIQVISTSDVEQLLITAGSQSEIRTVALRALAIAVN